MSSEYDRLGKKYRSSLHYMLAALVPYTEANIKLSFKPNAFFNDLEKLDQIKLNKNAIKTTYYRAIKNGYIAVDQDKKLPILTSKGHEKLMPFKPKKLKDSSLMVIFDIPEKERAKRRNLRLLLRELAFKQIQKSVWVSKFDSRKYLELELKKNHLGRYVQIYEAKKI